MEEFRFWDWLLALIASWRILLSKALNNPCFFSFLLFREMLCSESFFVLVFSDLDIVSSLPDFSSLWFLVYFLLRHWFRKDSLNDFEATALIFCLGLFLLDMLKYDGWLNSCWFLVNEVCNYFIFLFTALFIKYNKFLFNFIQHNFFCLKKYFIHYNFLSI